MSAAWPFAALVLWARPFALGALLPLLVRGMPWPVRAACGAALALGFAPAAPPAAGAFDGLSGGGLGLLLVSELAIGAALAVFAGAGVWAASAAGRLALRGPGGGALQELLGVGAVAALLSLGAHRPVLRALAMSWRSLPPGAPVGGAAQVAELAMVGAGATLVAVATAFAVPALAATLASRGLAAWMGDRGFGSALAILAALAAFASVAVAGAFDAGLLRALAEGLGGFGRAVGAP